MKVKINCCRCRKTVKGLETEKGTAGFYKMVGSAWIKYRRNDEIFVCDHCMLNDPEYIKDYPHVGKPNK